MTTFTLNNGLEMPVLGYGTFRSDQSDLLAENVKKAIQVGYRSIDTAFIYKNEESVGKGIQAAIDAGIVTREELFITTKVWNDGLDFEGTLKAYEDSLKRLSLDYVDLYLIHWPGLDESYVEVWKALEHLYNAKKVKAIGVCNFHVHHLDHLLKNSMITPAINQIELSPKLTQNEVREFCAKHDIYVEAWSPLMNGELLTNDTICTIAKKYNKTAAQIILRWDIQSNIVTIPKSMTPSRIEENFAIFDFELSQEDLETINQLNEDFHYGPNPENFDFGR
ncbi:glyoxal reductase [Kurthia zopfii]|uniref:Diketogulonate reductase-like aldo/keto reductase n=1 Tax=Kurthia zopfii TaxID=1650 RepID=A0A2U3AF90_9BACL|nr:aldo/keto reductase [Kurthia zopfii]PWI23222.1 aldo/keto reductase [Kurthia zopfii]TDR41401.1 diketogulonate reductase-like aldo/keto reductase [Kurthia zopfii]STX09906.1 Glyoxal reductase [Kurthia zopfii]VEI07379.1 Glyoxal reductase [Kurthia zopfii]GEK30045.1 glyoxal reductase [Kurthia zopfii]